MGLNNARKYKTHRKPNDILTCGMLGAAEQKNKCIGFKIL